MRQNPKRIPNYEIIGWAFAIIIVSIFAAIGLLVTIMEVKEFLNF